MFACKYRFKGDHDSEGGAIKNGNKTNVISGENGTTPWEFYKGALGRYTLTEVDTEKKSQNINAIHTREIFYVTYDKDEF